jgi:MFS family permease
MPHAERALDLLNLALSDVRYGLGSYLAVYLLAEHQWDEATIGIVLSLCGLAGLIAQTPLAAVLDRAHNKRVLLATAVAIATAAWLFIPLAPRFWPVVIAGVVGSIAGVVMAPAIAALSLGIVGPARFALRAGRNEALFHAGNAGCNIAVAAAGPFFGSRVVFWLLAVTGVASVAATFAIRADAVDHELSRGLGPGVEALAARRSLWSMLAASRSLKMFAVCGALFHLANAAMLPLVGQKLSLLMEGQGIALTAACAIAAQVVMVPTALFAGSRANVWGHKPLMVAAFMALALRGFLFTLWDEPAWLIAVQSLDGVGSGLMGALTPVVVADLTYGTGHFNAGQGAVATVHSLGAIASTTVAGQIVVAMGYETAFLTLSSVAAIGALLYWQMMPETSAIDRMLVDRPGKDTAADAGANRSI